MRVIKGVVIGLTLSTLAYVLWRPTLAWALTRIPPVTPHGWTPKHMTFKNGVRVYAVEGERDGG